MSNFTAISTREIPKGQVQSFSDLPKDAVKGDIWRIGRNLFGIYSEPYTEWLWNGSNWEMIFDQNDYILKSRMEWESFEQKNNNLN
jgi:hypothetical protein